MLYWRSFPGTGFGWQRNEWQIQYTGFFDALDEGGKITYVVVSIET